MSYQAKDTMTNKLITIDWKASLTNAFELMKKNSIRHLPVRNDDSVIVGMLSERDLLRAMRSDYSKDHLVPAEYTQFSAEAVVREYMNWPVKTVSKKENLEQVVHKMLHDKISSVLVVDEDQELVGIITTDDLISLLLTFLREDSEKKNMNVGNLFDSDWIQTTLLI
ncbi:MAG: CBS domain-containing protein [Bdellovibrionaceae bacterium]|nr:CBS domain-containing protein [Pseudobdellovibrionaceae bacterium]NUM57162.1 CBS domain-containing protein [Pseudobdellovibrionaceae bacterium]